jgi:hypothetical protein
MMSGPVALSRARALLETLEASPFVALVEGERFDGSRPGLLGFELVLTMKPTAPL